jgi:hypothetical protein
MCLMMVLVPVVCRVTLRDRRVIYEANWPPVERSAERRSFGRWRSLSGIHPSRPFIKML